MNLEDELREYLKQAKEKLLLEHLEHYRYRRTYLGEEDDRGGRVRCFRFYLGDEEEIAVEKYSQVIVNEKKLKVFIINYKEADEDHCIMQGDISDRSSLIKVQKVHSHLEKTFEDLTLDSSPALLRVNYSHCFLKDKLYLFWPQ